MLLVTKNKYRKTLSNFLWFRSLFSEPNLLCFFYLNDISESRIDSLKLTFLKKNIYFKFFNDHKVDFTNYYDFSSGYFSSFGGSFFVLKLRDFSQFTNLAFDNCTLFSCFYNGYFINNLFYKNLNSLFSFYNQNYLFLVVFLLNFSKTFFKLYFSLKFVIGAYLRICLESTKKNYIAKNINFKQVC